VKILVLAAALLLPPPSTSVDARIEEVPSCWQIRTYVAVYGRDRVIRWALAHGLAQSDIDMLIKKCLRD
jgi:hypothetical protein